MKISFAGCGFLGVYQFAVGDCMRENAPWLLENMEGFYGCSIGSVVAAKLACGGSFMAEMHIALTEFVERANVSRLGVLSSKFDAADILYRLADSLLPKDAHRKVKGRLRISVTEVPSLKNRILDDFNTRNELITALCGSCFIPIFSNWNLRQYRGKTIIDGGFTNNLPFGENEDVITVSPFPGDFDICPSHLDPYPDATQHFLDVNNMNIQVNTWNWRRLICCLVPPSLDELSRIQQQGYTDTLAFLRNRGFVSGHVCRPVTAAVDGFPGGNEEISGVVDSDEEECQRDDSVTGAHIQSLPVRFFGRRRSSETSDYFSITGGSSPWQSICLSEAGEAGILEEVDSVIPKEGEQGVGDARTDIHCESNLQPIRALKVRRRHSWTKKDALSPRLLSMATQCIYATLQGVVTAPRVTTTQTGPWRRHSVA